MQLTTWPLARLGSRFGLLLEPQRRRVLHSALGRFLDEPLDLAVGVTHPDGRERILPLAAQGETFHGCEQFERINSITYRGHCPDCGVRFELNLHSPFYPRHETLCVLPVIYIELRITGESRIRLRRRATPPEKVRLFVRIKRPGAAINLSDGRIDLSYEVPLAPRYESSAGSDETFASTDHQPEAGDVPRARVVERIQSLNEGATPSTDDQGRLGLTLELPVTEEGSGIKWRLVWAAHTADAVLNVNSAPAKLRYTRHWADLDAVMNEAITSRDDNLALSRRFEKVLEQAPLERAQWHLLVMAFQSWLSNTFWCDRPDGSDLLTTWDGNIFEHNRIDAVYAQAPLYLALWPELLQKVLAAAITTAAPHKASEGAIIGENIGAGLKVGETKKRRPCPVEHNGQLLLLLGACSHLTGDMGLVREHAGVIRSLAQYLLWADRDDSGLVSEGAITSLDDAAAALGRGPNQTHLAIHRACSLMVAGDLLQRVGLSEPAERMRTAAAAAVPKIESEAWLGDHYAVAVDRSRASLLEPGERRPVGVSPGWDDYGIHTAQAMLLPAIVAQPLGFDLQRLRLDVVAAHRETLRNYGCTHTSSDIVNLSISLNLWRDFAARYIHADLPTSDQRYWDLQLYSNTGDQTLGYADRYIGHEMAFGARGAAAMGHFFAGPRLQLDRLDGEFFAVDPDRHHAQRWPLLALADWAANKIPVCVVNSDGRVRIEGGIEPVKVLGGPEPAATKTDDSTIG